MSGNKVFDKKWQERVNSQQKRVIRCKRTWYNYYTEKEEECNNEKVIKSDLCNDYVCPNCDAHYTAQGSLLRYCAICDWNKQNFDPLDAGESWEPEPSVAGFDNFGFF